MINILKNIFTNKGYGVQDAFQDMNQVGFIGSTIKPDRRDYYFLLDVSISTIKDNSIDNIIDEMIKKYWNINLLKNYGVESDYKKNTSLLLLVKVDSVSDEYSLSNKIYDIEESPYFFKRYVILYTDEQRDLIKDININDYLDVLSDKENFRIYKKNRKGEETINKKLDDDVLLYDIISKLYIKIPFFVYDFNENDKLPILAERINEALDDKQKEILNILIDTDLESKNYYESFNEILDKPTGQKIEEKYNEILKEISTEID